ncbi:hypothetical protein [Pajaroellobacter abortibovis]|uniref:Uncharacterized protein n=1 Tax=Pajaroellobacter abortibovis TaxID=1882918 RepID=A0A1L6MXX3_9BACT|nr:hypothetical protein [Pajaroellobacter abortibovis]APS00342.1 hypothetical protein BCY86_06365 [Pajaroellobacter abortibovis]
MREVPYRVSSWRASLLGVGTFIAGAVPVFAQDKIYYRGLIGRGIDWYLSSLAGQSLDAEVDDIGYGVALPVVGGIMAYEKKWWDSPLR